MKKILIIIPSFSSGGGAEKILSKILISDDFIDYKIDILEIYKGDKGHEELPSDIKVINHYIKSNSNKYLNLFLEQLAKYFPNLLRRYLLKNNKYDIEITFEVMYPDVPFSKYNNKKIAWIHGSIENFKEKKYNWRKKRYKKHFEQANKIVTISNKTKQSILDIYPETKNKIELIYNGYDFNDLEKKSLENIDIDIEDLSICSVGRIEEKKGSGEILEIIKNLHNSGYKYHLYFIGSGSLEEKLKQKTKEYNLEKYIHFLGYKKNPYKYIKKMKILLSMSKQEGFPGVYVESMFLGVPFVSTDVGGSEELSQNGKYGKVIYNKEQAQEAIVRYIEEKELVNKKEMKLFIKNFSLSKQVKNFKKLIDMEDIS